MEAAPKRKGAGGGTACSVFGRGGRRADAAPGEVAGLRAAALAWLLMMER